MKYLRQRKTSFDSIFRTVSAERCYIAKLNDDVLRRALHADGEPIGEAKPLFPSSRSVPKREKATLGSHHN